ncbi:16S rRNA (guanine(966)-N(2))-methyltransferase RsmD [Aureimonas leprariae]|uniref:16S rRNA (Guanine(966)-N(2))-methyltransferase RsmD n=1 Tax=Plantimonas leprariae TaxID=2615207 RepID=A0A7V7TYD5_9HYPH|nr:16S rRNA (guanine(966)-N(2))-methyltransferase RsmD [Aureimonas leprariae]KAB0682602.1 16S rRNA (guanine(966)-N(2))-methyltransferase RsmD [Aureimonas leprariae]
MRIVGGRFRGRAIATPKTDAIRPTTDRARETLFNILGHAFPGALDGARVLDLFSGTGALGIEALSRGARFCLFVEKGVEARGLLRANIEAFGLTGATKLFRRDATKLGDAAPQEPFDLLFADPPYTRGLGDKALASARDGGWLKRQALCVAEEAAGAPFEVPDGFAVLDERRIGDSLFRFLRFEPAALTKT